MKELRQFDSLREETIMDGLGFVEKILGYFSIAVCSTGYFLIVYFYFYLAFSKKMKKKYLLLLLLSTSPILLGILNTDRSNAFYWVLLVCMGYFIFKPYINDDRLAYLRKVLGILFFLVALYFTVVSITRFSESDWGATDALVDYIGQPYLIFCNEWNYLIIKGFSLNDILPFLKLIPWYVPEHQIINNANFSANGFPTYVGTIMRTMGRTCAIIMPILLFVISKKIASKITILNVKEFMVLFVLFLIPQTGIISFFFNNEWRFLGAFFYIYVTKKMNRL